MSARHKGRKRALDILYAADLRRVSIAEVLAAEALRVTKTPDQRPAFEFGATLVEGVVGAKDRIDELISSTSTDWPLERMPIVDRSVLRLGVYELLAMPETPTAVVIAEAGGLASEYSTDDSRGFIQGVLGTIAERVRGAGREGFSASVLAAGSDTGSDPEALRQTNGDSAPVANPPKTSAGEA
ncbi:MAG: transcription antitermination factor NusB [Pontimonas sp.]